MPYSDPVVRAEYERARRADPDKHARRLELDKLRYHAPDSKYRRHDKERHAKAYAEDETYRARCKKNIRASQLARAGWTLEQFDVAWVEQNGLCAVCGTQMQRTSHNAANAACADHCHDTGRRRGILCKRCNTAEGYIRNIGLSPIEWGHRLDSYLKEYQ